MPKLRIVSDVHGEYWKYLDNIKDCEYSVQIGDTGYSNHLLVHNLNYDKHKFFPGNHNAHDIDYTLPNCLGRFGYKELNGIKFFFVSGGFSLDWQWRKRQYFAGGPKTWFENEELNRTEQDECLQLYAEIKPDLVLTHEAPRSIVHHFTNRAILKDFGYDPDTFTTETSELLDRMLEVHRPKELYFGHYHQNWSKEIDGTVFRCIKDQEYYDYEN